MDFQPNAGEVNPNPEKAQTVQALTMQPKKDNLKVIFENLAVSI